jgi:restriction system protein
MLALEPAEFEAWTAMLFQLMGYRVTDTKTVGDHGIDLVVNDGRLRLGLVQCKRYRGTVGEGTVRDLYGTMMHERAGFAWLATTGAVSRQAREWAQGKPMELWDGKQMEELARRYR